METQIVLVFYVHCIKLEESQSHHFPIHCWLLVFFNWMPFSSSYRQIYLLNTCKLDGEENLFDFYVESITFKTKIHMNVTSI